MQELLTQHLAESIIALGLILLTIEVVILGFSTFILFFVGLALVITGTLIWLTILPESYSAIMVATALISGVLAVTLWQPLKRMQGQTESKDVVSEFAGERFFIEQEVTPQATTEYKFSGIMWKLKSEQIIAAGTEVEIVKVEVGILWVKPVDS